MQNKYFWLCVVFLVVLLSIQGEGFCQTPRSEESLRKECENRGGTYTQGGFCYMSRGEESLRKECENRGGTYTQGGWCYK
jgi:hypothetical protein